MFQTILKNFKVLFPLYFFLQRINYLQVGILSVLAQLQQKLLDILTAGQLKSLSPAETEL